MTLVIGRDARIARIGILRNRAGILSPYRILNQPLDFVSFLVGFCFLSAKFKCGENFQTVIPTHGGIWVLCVGICIPMVLKSRVY
jgi:hypothetical protein